jgi:hypothetical protein
MLLKVGGVCAKQWLPFRWPTRLRLYFLGSFFAPPVCTTTKIRFVELAQKHVTTSKFAKLMYKLVKKYKATAIKKLIDPTKKM